jgi:hypothetical protein
VRIVVAMICYVPRMHHGRRLGPPLAHFPRCPPRSPLPQATRRAPQPKRLAGRNGELLSDAAGDIVPSLEYNIVDIHLASTIILLHLLIFQRAVFGQSLLRLSVLVVPPSRDPHNVWLSGSPRHSTHHLDLPRRRSLSLSAPFPLEPVVRYQKLFINPFEGSCRAKAK